MPHIRPHTATSAVAMVLLHCSQERVAKGGTMTRVWLRVIVAAVLGTGAVSVGAAAGQDAGRPDGLQLFAERVAAYAELHQRVDAVFPPWKATDDVASIFRRRAYLAAAIKAERPSARQGDIFPASAASAVRGIVADALGNVDVEFMLEGLYEECEMPVGYHPQVNAGYPQWATHEMPFVLLTALPVLPAGIQYRLIDHDLLLWDVDANLIVDVLPDAIPRAGS
jgi:hypothetical protein